MWLSDLWHSITSWLTPGRRQSEYRILAVGALSGTVTLLAYHRERRVFYLVPVYRFRARFGRAERIHLRDKKGYDIELTGKTSFSLSLVNEILVVAYEEHAQGGDIQVIHAGPLENRVLSEQSRRGGYRGRTIAFPRDKGYGFVTGNHILYLFESRECTLDPNKASYQREILAPRDDHFDHASLSVLAVDNIDEGLLVLYQSTYSLGTGYSSQIGFALFDHRDPYRLLFRSQRPLWEGFAGSNDLPQRPLGAVLIADVYHVVIEKDEGLLDIVQFPQPYATMDEGTGATLERHQENPILTPDGHPEWGTVSTFNPAATLINNEVHLFYRAQGPTWISIIGHAISKDGYCAERSSDDPVYVRREPFEGKGIPLSWRNTMYMSGGSAEWGAEGCEDPRVTRIGDTLYMIYAAYNGYEQARLVITSIEVRDVLRGNWCWSPPQLMTTSPRVWGLGNKNAALFPEKINGKYVIFHRIWPNICIDYVDDLDFSSEHKWLVTKDIIPIRPAFWDSYKVGAGAPPLKTKDGWLLIYQALGAQDPRGEYKIGAMLLDLKDPSKVLHRSSHPILAPKKDYEDRGIRHGVTYPCGAVIKDGRLFVYYGGADKYACVASAPLDEFLQELKNDRFKDLDTQPLRIR